MCECNCEEVYPTWEKSIKGIIPPTWDIKFS